ncbi:dihydrofolate reductase family protein [Microlunatus parietis]|uniref:Dihydrofolate reductase n=1 Tax=Microlunatus parietis TaxID=682979 RepID=A0A7Y9I477_9ACTN|nr:dihydrofolate reductase family protein [Microlunatus parietis]NYE69818.1 dihydrofolate reductase [Microlunatus parietis]
MRKLVLAMMTTVNGRLDDPDAWTSEISDDHYREIDRGYAAFDTILVGRVTAAEMIGFWPGQRGQQGAGETHLAMAEKMHTYRKHVITSDENLVLDWHNAEVVLVRQDDDLAAFVEDLKSRPGADIHLSGGARLAQTLVRLGLVDEYRFFVNPVHSPGATWYELLDDQQRLELINSLTFENGVVALTYRPVSG